MGVERSEIEVRHPATAVVAAGVAAVDRIG